MTASPIDSLCESSTIVEQDWRRAMAKRDPAKTARNKRIKDMKAQLRELLPTVLKETAFTDEASLNAKIGGKADDFIDLKNEVIHSPTDYAAKYLEGFARHRSKSKLYKNACDELYNALNSSKAAQQYMMLFLERSYLKHFEELSKHRPSPTFSSWVAAWT
jgi:hypothetical protein